MVTLFFATLTSIKTALFIAGMLHWAYVKLRGLDRVGRVR